MFWIQDGYLKGDKHYKARIAREMEAKRLERLKLAELSRKREIAKNRDLQDFSDKSDTSFVEIHFKGRLIEQIEDGIYNIQRKGSGVGDYELEDLDD
jgi:threonyl-tRNA synthetase